MHENLEKKQFTKNNCSTFLYLIENINFESIKDDKYIRQRIIRSSFSRNDLQGRFYSINKKNVTH